jgi:hypothetical protein
MHFNFDFSAHQIIWTLTFAALMVLLVVLLGRDRARRYPWFTAGIVLFALQLMAEVLLTGRMANFPLQATLLTLADLATIVSLMVVVEMARRAFAGMRSLLWIVNSVGLLLVAGGVLCLKVWGPWPAMKELAWDSTLGKLHLMYLVEQKGDLLVALLTVGLGLLVVLFGRRFKAGWRSHTQMIVIGLSMVAIALLVLQGVVQSIVQTAQPHSRAEYERILDLLGKLVNANKVVYLIALVWWIVWLWLDEPGAVQEWPAQLSESEKLTLKTLDFSEGPYIFHGKSALDVVASLKSVLPPRIEVTLNEGAKSKVIRVSDGMWRGALLAIDETGDQTALLGISYEVLTLDAKVVVFIGTCAALSITITLLASIIAGKFVPVASLGGFLGLLISRKVRGMISKKMGSSSWATRLKEMIERANV